MSGSTGCPVFFLFFLFGLGPFGKSRVACCCLGPRPRLMLQPPYYTRLCPATVDAYRLSLSLTVIHAYTRTTFPHSFLSLSFLLSLSFSLLPHYSSLCGALNFPPSLQTFPFAFACFLPSFAPRNKKKRASGNSLQQGASSYRCCRLRTYVLKRPFFPPFYLPYKVVNEISRSVVVCVCVCARTDHHLFAPAVMRIFRDE